MTDTELLREPRVAAQPASLTRRRLWRNLLAVGVDWTLMLISIWAVSVAPWWTHPMLLFVIATRQHALLVIMHDASHHMFHTNRVWNDIIADILCALPFLITVRGYRANHIAHHDHLNTSEDPDIVRKVGHGGRYWEWTFPASRLQLLRLALRDLSGMGFLDFSSAIRTLRSGLDPGGKKVTIREEYPHARIVQLTFLLAIGLLIWWTGRIGTVLYAYLVPFFCIVPALLRLRSIAEHFALPRMEMLDSTRNIVAAPLELFFLAPHNISLHLAHHLFPYVPWHELPELHRRLLGVSAYRDRGYKNDSYLFGNNSVLSDLQRVSDEPTALIRNTAAAS